MTKYSNITFMGYRRENGRVGVRETGKQVAKFSMTKLYRSA